jgi:hypothetical protein
MSLIDTDNKTASLNNSPRLVHYAPSLPQEDLAYVRAAHALTVEALGKGCDVTHLPEGELWVTEVKTITYKYFWNSETQSFERSKKKRRRTVVRKNISADKLHISAL